MNEQYDSKNTKQSETRRSLFDFSSVEDLRETDQNSDLFPSDKTRPKIPFNESYIAHAPSRHLFTMSSRYTYFGGYGAFSKDISGSVEDLTGYTKKQRRTLSLGKFSKSSPNLLGASYQSSDGDNVTKKKTRDLVTKLDIETTLENESEHGNEDSAKSGKNNEHGNGSESVTETQHKDTKFRLETKWTTNTENEAGLQLNTSTLKIETAKQNTSNEMKNGLNTTAGIIEELDIMIDEEGGTTHAQHPGANNAIVNSGSECFDKGWKTILHSGKADLKRSLENLNSFRQDMNVVDTFGSKRFVSADVEQEMNEETHWKEVDTEDNKTGMKRNGEIEELNMDELNMDELVTSEKRRNVSEGSSNKIFSKSNTCDSNTAVNEQRNHSEITTTEDSRWMASYEERCTKDNVNTNHNTTTSSREKTANENEEKQAALSVIENDNADLCTLTERDAGVNRLCPTLDIFHANYNILTSEVSNKERSYDNSRSTATTVLQMDETTRPQTTIDDIESFDKTNERCSKTDTPQSCNISPISFRVLNTTSCDQRQKTEEYKRESTIAIVKISDIQQSSICVTKDEKITEDYNQYLVNSCIKEPRDNRLYNSSYGGSFETPNSQEPSEPFNNDYDHNSTHEPNSDWLTNTTYTGNVDSPMYIEDNSLVKNMMGMFCLLGLKDSPERDFYSNEQCKEQMMTTDISSVGNEQEWSSTNDANIPTEDINKTSLTFNNSQESIHEQESFNDIEAERWITWKQNINGSTAVDRETFDDSNIVEGRKIQQITLDACPQKQVMVEEYISDVLTGNTIALEETSISVKDLLLNAEPDTILPESDFENGKQKKAVQHENTKETIHKGIITQTQELLLEIPDDAEGNLATQNEVDDFEGKDETIVELDMQEKQSINFGLNIAGLIMASNEKSLSFSQDNTREQNMEKIITTTNLEINRNRWSSALIIPLRTKNVSEKFSSAFNVLVLDNNLNPTRPERKPTMVKLNLFPSEAEKMYSQNVEVSQVKIEMNVEKDHNTLQEDDRNVVEEQVTRSNSTDNNLEQTSAALRIIMDEKNYPDQVDYTKQLHEDILTADHDLDTTVCSENRQTIAKNDEIQQPHLQTEDATTNITFMENVYEKHLPDTKETNEIINDERLNDMQPEHFANIESDCQIHETVHKVEAKTMRDKRLSEHLMCFEMNELLEEKITKEEKTENLFSELDEIFLQENEIQETISKDERIEYEAFSEVDEFFASVEVEEQETDAVMKYPVRNNEVALSELTTQKVSIQRQEYSSQPERKVSEIITKAIDERTLQYKYFSKLDEVLKREYVQEIIPNKVEHDKQNYLSKTDKYFDSITQEAISEKINKIQLKQSSEVPELGTDWRTKYIENSIASTSDLISLQNNENEIVQTEKDTNNGGKDQEGNAWEITFNDQNVSPTKDVVPTASNDNMLNKNRDEFLVIPHSEDPMNSNHLHEEDRSDDDIKQCTVLPIPDNLLSVTSNYDASSSESTQGQHQESGENYLMNVPWDVTVSYSNPVKSEYKILRASYSNIQQEMYKVDTAVTIDGKTGEKYNPRYVPKQSDISEHLHTTHPSVIQTIENNFNINIDVPPETQDKGNEYRTIMDIQNHNQVSTSYMLFQRFGKHESPKTYFELNYDTDKWKVGKKVNSNNEEDSEKSFVVSYATIEQVNQPGQETSSVYLPSIEEEIYDQEICDIEATKLANDEEVKIGFLRSSSPLRQQLTDDTGYGEINHHLPIPPPEDLPYQPSTVIQAQRLPTPPTDDTGHVDINHHLPTPDLPYQPPGIIQAQRLPTPPTDDTGHVDINHHLPTPPPPPDLPYQPPSIIQAQRLPTPPTDDTGHVDINHHLPTPEDLSYQPSGTIQVQRPPTPSADDTGHVKMNHHLPPPPADLPYESPSTIHTEVPPSVPESRPAVWSFAQSVFHTDGQNKTFFKVIDNRKKSFQSSTFMYRGERVKVSRGVNIFKSSAKDWNENIEQTSDSRVNENYEGYSEIWDDGNMMSVDSEPDGAVTKSTVAYEMATEQDLFNEESRNCAWHLKLHEAHGVCKISSDNLDAIAIEGDNTLLGSEGFLTGQHRWVIQGLGVFCAVGICSPGGEVENWYKGDKWVWTTDGLKYSEPTGIQRSEFGQWRNEDVLTIALDCDEQKLTIVNTRTSVEATLHGFKGEVYPYFNIYKGSSIRLLQTTFII